MQGRLGEELGGRNICVAWCVQPALQAHVAEHSVVCAKVGGEVINRGLCDEAINPALPLCIQQPLEGKL